MNWSDEQVWDFIRAERIPYCQLYDEEGITRIGCVGCPLASSSKILAEFKRWPQFEKAYLWAFEKMLEGRSFDKWKTKFDVMDWYIYGAEEDCRGGCRLGVDGDIYLPTVEQARELIEGVMK